LLSYNQDNAGGKIVLETVKTMLIVEDRPQWQNTIAYLCRQVHKKLYDNPGKVVVVSSIGEATNELEKRTVHFASVDLNLEGDTRGTKDPSGLKVLEKIEKMGLDTVSIVVSGEYDPEFAAVSKKYKALTFQKKSKADFPPTYLAAVEAALLYVEAKELLDAGKYGESLKKWKQAQEVVKPIERSGAKDWTFPIDIEEKYKSQFRHPITTLPTTLLIEDEIRRLIFQDNDWILFYIQIEHLDAFSESQGQPQTDVLLRTTKDLLQKVFAVQSIKVSFFGQKIKDNIFVVSSEVSNLEDKKIKDLIENLKKEFDEESLPFYDYVTREERREMLYKDKQGNRQTSPLASLKVGFVKDRGNEFVRGYVNDAGDVIYGKVEQGDVQLIDEAAEKALHGKLSG
jgi:ActR/RegA family two-component response regulator